MTYALSENRKTIARASYSMFSSQLNATAAGHISAVQYSAIYYYAIDTNGNKIADPNEILFGLGNLGYYGFDPLDPQRLTTINQIGKYATQKTHEFMFGMDHELMPNFGISSTITYRHFNHFNWTPRIGVTSPKSRPWPMVTCSSPGIRSLVGSKSIQPRSGTHVAIQACEASAPTTRPRPGAGSVAR